MNDICQIYIYIYIYVYIVTKLLNTSPTSFAEYNGKPSHQRD